MAVGAACIAAGWSWLLILFAFFLTGTGLSRIGEEGKQLRTGSVVAKGGARDQWQVLANGGVFAAAAIASLIWPSIAWQLFGTGAIAASTADTWATEIGTQSQRAPRSIVSWRVVEAGTSGGVTWTGFAASLAGALFIGLVALLSGWPARAMCAAVAGGFAGSLIDSLLGATLQARRWCGRCERGTERAVHICGTVTTHSGGITWLRNDLVNAVSSLGGALIGLLCLL